MLFNNVEPISLLFLKMPWRHLTLWTLFIFITCLALKNILLLFGPSIQIDILWSQKTWISIIRQFIRVVSQSQNPSFLRPKYVDLADYPRTVTWCFTFCLSDKPHLSMTTLSFSSVNPYQFLPTWPTVSLIRIDAMIDKLSEMNTKLHYFLLKCVYAFTDLDL